jgi:preprotein translocase subunit SecF
MDFVGKRKIFYILSAVILVVCIGFAIRGLHFSIEFTGGTTMTVQFNQSVSQADLMSEMASLGHGEAQVTKEKTGPGTSGSTFFIRTKTLTDTEETTIHNTLTAKFGPMDSFDINSFSNEAAKAITNKAVIAVVFSSLAIMLYIAWAFRKMKHAFRLGVCAIVAMIHDAIVCIGVYAIVGTFFGVQVDTMFITAILTVVGYSVTDTIVVYDRIRENSLKHPGLPLATNINNSILETIARSINTSMTVVFVLLALYLIGGSSIHNFVLVLLVGIIIGTYSSIFIASPLLIEWETGRLGRVLQRLNPRRALARG